ncbi:MAG: ROK family protein [Oscillospiraceae bacterium]|jgi:glucokinase|nr:ROK family protein [Oscillospiraceae bacterium]
MYLGVDIGGTNISVGIVDEQYKIVGRGKRKSYPALGTSSFCDDVASAISEAASNAGMTLGQFGYCGVGCPGVINTKSGVVEYSNNLDFYNLPLAKMLTERINIPVILGNDANAAALGEVLAGAAKGARNAVAVTLGTGVGAGIITDGKIYLGCNGSAGEIGHTLLVKGGELCTCGRRGCFEAYASANALKRQTAQAMRENPQSKMWDICHSDEKVSGKTAFEAMRMGDEAATAVVDTYIDYLADGLTDIINILQPEILCIGGGVSKEGEHLTTPLAKLIEQRRFTRGNVATTLVKCAELLNDAGIIGAAMLGRYS